MAAIAIKNAKGIQTVSIEPLLNQKRMIFVRGEIDEQTAIDFMQQVAYLNCEDPETPITVCINSAGGEINSGMLMYDVIQSSKAPIRLYYTGKAYSMAAVLLACGKPGSRYGRGGFPLVRGERFEAHRGFAERVNVSFWKKRVQCRKPNKGKPSSTCEVKLGLNKEF